MDKKALIDKYTELSRKSDKRLETLHVELKAARKAKNERDSGWEELADYEFYKAEHLSQKRVSQIFDQICHDLGEL